VLKKSLLELGGSDAFIVLADANIDLAVEAGIQARFQNTGQVCLAAKRFILERPIAEEFIRKFVAAAKALTVGILSILPMLSGQWRARICARNCTDRSRRPSSRAPRCCWVARRWKDRAVFTNRPCWPM
jgi:hypothetical protein